MGLLSRLDWDEARRLVKVGADVARRGGETEAISRWCAADEDEEYLRRLAYHVADLLSLHGEPPPGFVLLDAGGGSGLLSVLACLMGAARAVVIDMNRPLIEFLQQAAPALAPRVSIEGHLRDVSRTGMADTSFDVVLCNEALSHMIDIEGFLSEVTRVLAPGGRLVISDSNNETNPRVRRARIHQWRRFEATRRHEDGPGELYLKRRALIAGRFAGADASLVEEIAEATFGMTGDQVLAAAERRLRDGHFAGSYFDGSRCPIDPLTDQCADRLFSPYDLGRDLGRHGFKARVRAHFATVPPYRVLNGIWGVMSPLTLPLSKAFRIVAVKQADV